ASDRHDTVGIDLVAMCVNDLLCTGAEPLFFLDYVAMGRDDPARLEKIVQGISDGCVQGDVALLGGETAIMPGLYGHADYDLAGFAVGVVERDKRIDGSAIRPGDQLIGIASSGIHSNGFSLVRKIVADNNLGWDAKVDALGDTTLGDTTLGEALLEPTRIYTGALRTIARHYKVKTVLRGIAHITGGGFGENIDRILPAGTSAIIHGGSWTIPPVFAWLQDQGKVPREEMYRVFNMGIGMVFVVGEFYADRVVRMLEDANFPSFRIGEIVVGDGRVSVQH
ncbi:MAG: phosphoribosylformylglycinamidine cyclo-ligase, partial [Planctomycetota bacterium]